MYISNFSLKKIIFVTVARSTLHEFTAHIQSIVKLNHRDKRAPNLPQTNYGNEVQNRFFKEIFS